MTPKEKAIELIDLCRDDNYFSENEILNNSKYYAKLIVNEIIKSWKEDGAKNDFTIIEWWNKVLKELDNLE